MTALQKWNVEYIPANAGLFLFAKVAKDAKTWEDEAAMVKKLRELGVLVTPGRLFHGGEAEKRWARVTFSVPEDLLKDALRRTERLFVQ